eukprot:612801-Pelagomonas_calceolata.AAC.1
MRVEKSKKSTLDSSQRALRKDPTVADTTSEFHQPFVLAILYVLPKGLLHICPLTSPLLTEHFWTSKAYFAMLKQKQSNEAYHGYFSMAGTVEQTEQPNYLAEGQIPLLPCNLTS